jgi:MoaA/NifB/PqqE/SkfB family radical SAM enzyme
MILMDETRKSLFQWKKIENNDSAQAQIHLSNYYGPAQAQIHLTNFCNLKCIFCPTRALVKELNRKKELTIEEWLRIIKEGNELGIREWHICGGGEPLFFTKNALTIMRTIKESNKYGEIITNGTFFQGDTAKEIVKMGWDKIYVSLDSPNAETQNFLRGVNCFEQIIKGIKNLVEWKEKFRSKKPLIYFHSVICNKNYKQVLELIELVYKIKIQGVLLNALNIWKPEANELKLNAEEKKDLKKILERCKKLASKFKIYTNIQDFLNLLLVEKANYMDKAMLKVVKEKRNLFIPTNRYKPTACYSPWFNVSIFADGRTLPCFILKEKGENVRERSLKEIWFGDYFSEVRQTFLKNRLKEDCSKCNTWNLPKMKEIIDKVQWIYKFIP